MARDMLDIQAHVRVGGSKSERNKLRNTGSIPAVLYGRHLEKPISLSVEEKTLKGIFKSESKHMAILKMDIGGTVHTSVLKAIGRDPVTMVPIHLDFQTVDLKEKSKFAVKVELINQESATRLDFILQQPLDRVELECLPLECPLIIHVDVSKYVKDGAVAHVRDLPVAAGVKILSDPDAPVLVVQAPVAPPPPTAAELAAAEAKAKPGKGGKAAPAKAAPAAAAPAKAPAKKK